MGERGGRRCDDDDDATDGSSMAGAALSVLVTSSPRRPEKRPSKRPMAVRGGRPHCPCLRLPG